MTELFRDLADGAPPRALGRGLWARRLAVSVLAAVVVLALLDVFGQREGRTATSTASASVAVSAPRAVRGGLLFQARVDVVPRRAVDHPRLVLGDGWVDGLQISSISPDAQSQSSRDGHLVLSYDTFPAGRRTTIWVQFQVDPTNVGRRSFDLELDDAERPIARVHRTLTVLP